LEQQRAAAPPKDTQPIAIASNSIGHSTTVNIHIQSAALRMFGARYSAASTQFSGFVILFYLKFGFAFGEKQVNMLSVHAKSGAFLFSFSAENLRRLRKICAQNGEPQ